MEWLVANIGTVAVLAIVSAIIGLAIFSIIRDKKKGKSSCGGSCSCCPMGGMCHGTKEKGK